MQLRQMAGVLYVLTALVSGYWEFNLLMRPLIGGPSSLWYPITLGTSVVLLIAGLLVVVSRTKSSRLVALVATLVLAVWWIPASMHTVDLYFSSRPPAPDSGGLVWTLVPGILVVISLIIGVASWKFLAATNGLDRPAGHIPSAR